MQYNDTQACPGQSHYTVMENSEKYNSKVFL